MCPGYFSFDSGNNQLQTITHAQYLFASGLLCILHENVSRDSGCANCNLHCFIQSPPDTPAAALRPAMYSPSPPLQRLQKALCAYSQPHRAFCVFYLSHVIIRAFSVVFVPARPQDSSFLLPSLLLPMTNEQPEERFTHIAPSLWISSERSTPARNASASPCPQPWIQRFEIPR